MDTDEFRLKLRELRRLERVLKRRAKKGAVSFDGVWAQKETLRNELCEVVESGLSLIWRRTRCERLVVNVVECPRNGVYLCRLYTPYSLSWVIHGEVIMGEIRMYRGAEVPAKLAEAEAEYGRLVADQLGRYDL
jgi:hypothetical protein